MIKLDHLSLPVSDHERSRDWYVRHFGFRVEFAVPARATVALQDDAGLTLFLVREEALTGGARCALTFQVDDVERKHRELSAVGVPFEQAPQKLFLGLRGRAARSRRLPDPPLGRAQHAREGRLVTGAHPGAPALALELEAAPPAHELRSIEEGLIGHARACGVEERGHRPLAVLLRDGEGRLVGGLVGNTVWGWLHVAQLWVAEELRGQGQGTALMRAAEAEAVRRGCHHVLLDTFDFQARGFYERLGYETFATLADFPTGHTRFFMKAALPR